LDSQQRAIKAANKQYKEEHASSIEGSDGGSEEGEMEMEEGEYEMVEEGESWSEHPSQEEVVVYPSGDEGVDDGS